MIADIQGLTEEFVSAISKIDFTQYNYYMNFRNFPRGCCGDTCDLLQYFLFQKGILTTYIAKHRIGKQGTHAWLEYEDYIIDPTIGQFPTYIGVKYEVTNNKSWHDKNFGVNIAVRTLTYKDEFNSMSIIRLDSLYKIILEQMNR
ncbi:hypothetical protein BC351_00540 [Paenibacillus ferrarius]|uniref:Microcin J25-processing protein McjB C-terminal domain-containing protein n=1 Tax=Paenibacillus ferrarius TaxID=1469647 RepID=A0A1V4HTD5_9BACL|nr:hypothetical protein [Paenibacillus ferrarius]OPH61763.1 hypothetical protein BC351_00540 [Paenibacillus ferrarius]